MSAITKVGFALEYAVAKSLLAALRILPTRLALGFGNGVARLLFLVMRRRRAIAIENVQKAGVATDEREVRRIARGGTENLVALVVETAIVQKRITPDNWDEHVRIVASKETETLLHEPNRGLIVASAHIGNWEIVGRAFSMIKPLSVVYRPLKNPYVDRAAHDVGDFENLQLIPKYDEDPMRFMRILAGGEILAMMIDQHAGSKGLRVDFFGRKASTTKAVALLHLITRAPLVVACAVRTGPLQFDVHVANPVEHERTGDRERDVFEITQKLTHEIERIVRICPEQYMWGHRRWRG